MVSFLQVFPLESCMHLTPYPYVPRCFPISFLAAHLHFVNVPVDRYVFVFSWLCLGHFLTKGLAIRMSITEGGRS